MIWLLVQILLYKGEQSLNQVEKILEYKAETIQIYQRKLTSYVEEWREVVEVAHP